MQLPLVYRSPRVPGGTRDPGMGLAESRVLPGSRGQHEKPNAPKHEFQLGRFWSVLVGFGRFWLGCWSVLVGFGRFWSVLVRFLVGFGRFGLDCA